MSQTLQASDVFAPIETIGPKALEALQAEKLARQMTYLSQHSDFYRAKFAGAGIDFAAIRTRHDLARVPFTVKQELRDSLKAAPPFGRHLAAARAELVQMQASSGTTGSPSYVALTALDRQVWSEMSARGLYACGIRPGDLVLHGFSMSKGFVGGIPIFQAIQRIGAIDVPIGADGGVDRLLVACRDLRPRCIIGTPNFLLYLAEIAESVCGVPAGRLGVERLIVGGEPGGSIPAIREKLQSLWNAKVCELMGGTDLGCVYWAECDGQDGMHMVAPDHILVELIEPDSGEPIAMEAGAVGELVYTALDRQASPLVRFRSGDHVVVTGTACACGRCGPKVRCFGRTDDMLIVRGVNVFPSAIQDVVGQLRPRTGGVMRVVADFDGHSTQRNLKVVTEVGEGFDGDAAALAAELERRIRDTLSIKADVTLVAAESFEKPGAAKVSLLLRRMPDLPPLTGSV